MGWVVLMPLWIVPGLAPLVLGRGGVGLLIMNAVLWAWLVLPWEFAVAAWAGAVLANVACLRERDAGRS